MCESCRQVASREETINGQRVTIRTFTAVPVIEPAITIMPKGFRVRHLGGLDRYDMIKLSYARELHR